MHPKRSDDDVLKLIIIGDCGVGKTNILVQYCQDTFRPNYIATIGVDFKIKTITVRDKRIKLQIWDTAGQERFKNITQAYYKGAAGIIMIYSIEDSKSFQNIDGCQKLQNMHQKMQLRCLQLINLILQVKEQYSKEKDKLWRISMIYHLWKQVLKQERMLQVHLIKWDSYQLMIICQIEQHKGLDIHFLRLLQWQPNKRRKIVNVDLLYSLLIKIKQTINQLYFLNLNCWTIKEALIIYL